MFHPDGTTILVSWRDGLILSGFDGYGNYFDVSVDHHTASRVGEKLCYVRTVTIVKKAGSWKVLDI